MCRPLAIILFASLTSVSVADESKLQFSDDVRATDAPSANREVIPDSEQSTPYAKDRRVSLPALDIDSPKEAPADNQSDWKPKLCVTLNVNATGRSNVNDETVSVYVPSPVPFNEGEGTRQLSYRKETRTVQRVVLGQAMLECDNVEIGISPSADGELSYIITCDKRARLVLNGMSISCDSLSIADGAANFTNASIENNGMTATAEKLQLGLQVRGVTTQKFGERPTGIMPAGQPFDDRFVPSDDDRHPPFPTPDEDSGFEVREFGNDRGAERTNLNDFPSAPKPELRPEASPRGNRGSPDDKRFNQFPGNDF